MSRAFKPVASKPSPKTAVVPTTRGVQQLLNSMSSDWPYNDPRVRSLSDNLEAMIENYKKTHEYRQAEKEFERVRAEVRDQLAARKSDVELVRKHFLAKGLTPDVLQMLAELVDKHGHLDSE